MSAAATGDAAMTALAPERPPVGLLLLAGLLALAIGVGGFGGWAAYAPLSSAAVARGVITVDGNRKVVQHLEGGSIAQLRVREGDCVRAGQRSEERRVGKACVSAWSARRSPFP